MLLGLQHPFGFRRRYGETVSRRRREPAKATPVAGLRDDACGGRRDRIKLVRFGRTTMDDSKGNVRKCEGNCSLFPCRGVHDASLLASAISVNVPFLAPSVVTVCRSSIRLGSDPRVRKGPNNSPKSGSIILHYTWFSLIKTGCDTLTVWILLLLNWCGW